MRAIDLLGLAYKEGACISATMCLAQNISRCPSLKAHEYFALMKRAHKKYNERISGCGLVAPHIVAQPYWSYKETLRGGVLLMTEYECALAHSWILWSFHNLLAFEDDSEFASIHRQLWHSNYFKQTQNLAAALVRAYSEE